MEEEKIKNKTINEIQDYFLGTGFYQDLTPKQKSEVNEIFFNIKNYYEVQDYKF